MDPEGFEPSTYWFEASRPIQTRPRAHSGTATSAFMSCCLVPDHFQNHRLEPVLLVEPYGPLVLRICAHIHAADSFGFGPVNHGVNQFARDALASESLLDKHETQLAFFLVVAPVPELVFDPAHQHTYGLIRVFGYQDMCVRRSYVAYDFRERVEMDDSVLYRRLKRSLHISETLLE